MKRVLQTKKGECGIAAIAMIADVSIEGVRQVAWEVLGPLDWGTNGLTDAEVVEVLRWCGIPARDGPDWPSIEEPALLVVPSLNYRGLLHYVVWDPEAEQYLDPSPGPLVYPDDGPRLEAPDGALTWVCWARAIVW